MSRLSRRGGGGSSNSNQRGGGSSQRMGGGGNHRGGGGGQPKRSGTNRPRHGLRGSAMASLSTALGTSSGGGSSYGGMTFNSALPSFSGVGGGAQVDTVRRLRGNSSGYGSRQQRPSSAGRVSQLEQRVEFSVNSDPVWRS